MKILVTGGAGFIGSHLSDRLLSDGHFVACVDDLSLGRLENISHNFKNPRFRFIKLDILKSGPLERVFAKGGFDCVFHLAANSDIQAGSRRLTEDLDRTFMTTFRVLCCMKKYGVKKIVFSSTSAVYGELSGALREDSGPLFPVSNYGAAKLAAEAYVSAFAANCGMRAWIFRFPNVIGERATHGVVFDFINKLRANPRKLVILGNGKQCKPYLYVKDLVDGMVFGFSKSKAALNCFNLGVSGGTRVSQIAKIVAREMGLPKVRFVYTGGSRGWPGDVPRFCYSLKKIHSLGWKASRPSDEAVTLAVRACLKK